MYNMSNIFKKEPPITGGSFFESKQNLKARESVINSNLLAKKVDENVKKYLNSENFTYNLYFLLQQQADYFTNIVQFRFNDKLLTENLYKVIRCAVIYGKAAIWWTKEGIIPYYINHIEYSPSTGKPVYMSCQLVDNVFSQKALEPNFKEWVIFDVKKDENAFDNVYILNSSSCGFGGLIRWLPFLKQLEKLLTMLYVHMYSYIKFVLYDVKDTSYVDKELELFFNNELPFLINLGDENLMRNKFKEFNFESSGKTALFEYLDKFLETYYNLIGRRYNVDFKKERNVSAEVDASQDNFDVLQNELKQYILLMLDWIKFKSGAEYVL